MQLNESEVMLPLCCCSLADGDLSQSGVRDDHGVNKRPAAAHLPHLLRHACHHGRLLCLPDQVSQGFLPLCFSATFFFFFFFPVSLFFIAQIPCVCHRLEAIFAFQFLNKLRKIIYRTWWHCTCSTPSTLWWMNRPVHITKVIIFRATS